MAELHTYIAGYCTHPACMALRGAGLRICRFPARAWRIRTQRRQWIWDTGYASHFQTQTRRGLISLYRRVTPVHFTAEDALAHQLRQEGINPHELDGILLSHFHGDHIAGLRDFPSLPIYCSGAGWAATRPLRGWQALRQAFVPGLIPDDFEQRLRPVETLPGVALPDALRPFEQGWPLPDSDGEVFIVPLPGHAAGHLGAFVHTESGWTLLASDAAWAPASYRDGTPPSRLAHLVLHDVPAYYRTLRQLAELHRNGRVRILLSHEGDI